jgi:VCBS repeat-containing protein
MSTARRSLVRSTLQNLRKLLSRREKARREMRRTLGQHFEELEPRLALTISSPLPGATDHIHPVLHIMLDGQEVVIPAGVGITSTANSNPHTHDFSGMLHIGEGGPAGTGTTVRNVTLADFFDVWQTVDGQVSGKNANAIFDTDATDGTPSPRIMDKTVDSTHVLRVYVKEAGDVAPELEYDSSSSSNDLVHPEDYVPRDGDQIYIVYEKATQPVDSPSFDTIDTQSVLGGAPTWIGINGFDPSGGPLTWSVTSSNPGLLSATLAPSTNKSLVLDVSGANEVGYGQMQFLLFDDLEPRTTQHIEALVSNGEFTQGAKFYRIAWSGSQPFVIQGGPSNPTSSLGKFDDEFNTDLQFTTSGLLAMAKSTDDTNDSQIFITGGPARFLDMQHSIFGVLTEGDAVRNAIQHANPSGDGAPASDTITITGAHIITNTQNTALMLKAAEGASGQADVTLTATDATGHSYSQTFHVNITPDTANSAPFLNPIAPITGTVNQPIQVQLSATDVEGDPFFFDATPATGETAITAANINVNSSTGLVTITPPNNFTGTLHVTFGVRGATDTSASGGTQDQFDTQTMAITVGAAAPAAPTSVDLDSASDTGTSNSDNITNASSLSFTVNGVTAGATVKLLKNGTVLAQGTVATGATSISLAVSNPSAVLSQGANTITATQTVSGQESAASSALTVTYDTTPPTFTSTPPTTAFTGVNLNYNAQTDEEGSGVVYSLQGTPPTGVTINSSTGVVTWGPTTAQIGPQSFTIVATDAAGNTRTQAVNVTVAEAAVSFTMTITTPDGTPLTTVAPGQDFVLHFFAQDVRSDATGDRGVFAAYTDITYDSTKVSVTGPITYGSNYGSGRTGDTSTAGIINDVGAFAGTSPLGTGKLEVFSVPMRAAANATGTLTITSAPGNGGTATDVLVFGQNGAVDPAKINFPTLTADVGSTFNAVNDSLTASQDSTANTLDVLANDASIGGATNTLTITAVGTTNHGGSVTITQNGTRLSYTPAALFTGTETFTYTVKNQNGEQHTATVTMNVTAINHAPTAANDTINVPKNSTSNTLNVLSNDTTTPDTAETLRISAVGTASHGTVTIGANGTTLVYTPTAGFTGTDTFTYTISDRAAGDSTAKTATATVTVNVGGLTAANDTIAVSMNASATTLDVLANDSLDATVGGTLTITSVGTTNHGGTVSITQNGTRLSYTPATGFKGAETFTYTIGDGHGNSSTATVTMNVSGPPTAANDNPSSVFQGANTLDVLANDTSGATPPGTLTVDASSLTQPAHGTVSVSSDGTKVIYTPTAGYSGADSFTYKAKGTDGQLSNAATVSFNVAAFQPGSLAGFAYFDVNNNGIKDAGELGIAGVTITLAGTPSGGSAITPVVVKTLDDGSYSFPNIAPGNYTITQTQPQFVIDGKSTVGSQGGTASGNVITISSFTSGTNGTGNNFGEVGRTPSNISALDFYSSNARNYAFAAFDSSGKELWHTMSGSTWQGLTSTTFSLLNSNSQINFQAINGQSSVNKTYSTTGTAGIYLAGSASGNLLYRVAADFVIGGSGNQVPVAAADTYTTPAGTALTVPAASGVLANDSDPEGHALTAVVATQPTHGTLTLGSDGSFTYTPTSGFNGTDTFTYRASDGVNQSAPATVTITVGTPTNNPPTANNDAYNATVSTTLNVTAANGVLKNDTDPENNALTATLVASPGHGSVALNSDGSFVYTPTSGFIGTDTFTYKASDGTNQSNVATVTITVANNQPPTANNDIYAATKNLGLSIPAVNGVLKNDTDPESQSLTASIVTQPGHGTVTLNSDGSFSYTPTADFTGTDTFTYKASDGTNQSNVATVTLNVSSSNSPPNVSNDNFTATKNTTLTINAPGVLANDSDPDGNPLSVTVVSTTTHGTLTLNPNGSFTYTPNTGYIGPDAFSYRASDGSQTADAIVNITVNDANNHAPVAANDTYTANENVPLVTTSTNSVLANDTDADANPLTAIVVSPPAHGSLSLTPNGTFTYTPNSNFVGTDTFTYKANDGLADSNVATVTITVSAVTQAPTAVADTYRADPLSPLVVPAAQGVLHNDTDPLSLPLTASLVNTAAHGDITLGTDGSFTYTPDSGFTGPDSFTYKASNGTLDSATTTVTINVNHIPSAVDDSYSTNEDQVLTVDAATGVLHNDTDADAGDTLTPTVITQPQHGTVSLNASGSFVYTPAANFHGTDTFRYQVSDGLNASDPATVTITVNSVNDAPAVANDTYATPPGTALTVNAAQGVLANDTDVDGDTLHATVATPPQHGTLSLGTDGSFTYTPNTGFSGEDTFTYTLSDGTVNAASPGTVTIHVNSPPAAVADAYSVDEDATLTVNAANGVLKNDTDSEDDALTAVVVAQPQHGTLSLASDGSFTYTPNADFSGTDTFTYKANDSHSDSNVVTVTLTVNPLNDAPVSQADAYIAEVNTPRVVGAAAGLLSNDTDADPGDTLTVATFSQPANGNVTVNADGSFTYTPNTDFQGTDTFTYKATDGTETTGDTTVTITVHGPNSAPVAEDDDYSTDEDTALTASTDQGVLHNDTDADDDPLAAFVVTQPQHGTLTFNSNGTFTYTPAADFHGTDTFTYKATDGLAESDEATVTITVNSVNDAPVGVADAYDASEDTQLVVDVENGLLANDTDADGTTPTIDSFTQPANGTVTVNDDGSFTYTPDSGFVGTDTFTYKATDGTTDSADTTVTITVSAQNHAPVAVDDGPFTTNEDTSTGVDLFLLQNDTDADDDDLTPVLVAQPQNGSVTLHADGTFFYTPAANFHGTDTFTYKVNDGQADSNVATVTITVNAVNDAPVGVADAYDAVEGTPLVVDAENGVLANDTDVDGTTPTVASFTQPANGTVTVGDDGAFTYTPDSGFIGTDTFTYKATDGTADSDDTTVTITVSAQNHIPVAVDDGPFTTDEDTALTIAASAVLANDTDDDDDTLTAAVVDQPQNGSVTLGGDGNFTYTPTANFHGTDSFTYKANDGHADSNAATVTITVNAVNDVPQGHFDTYAVAQDGTLTVTDLEGVLANDTDADDDPLTVTLVDDVENGTLSLNSDGSFTYTPAAGFTGTDTFTYKAKDGVSESDVTTVTIHVDAPPVVQDDPDYMTDEDTPLVVDADGGVLANDHDPELDPMEAVVVDQPQNGILSLGADGSFTYTPNPDFNGTDTFTYQVSDGVATSTIATVTITVNPVNDAPVTTDDAYTGAQDTQLVIAANSGVLSNDHDPDGDPLTVTGFTQPTDGTVTVGPDGSFTYVPDSGFTGDDSFVYTISDGQTITDGLVTISVQPAGGEGESLLAANDAALMALLAASSDPTGAESSDWQAAVDEAMSQLG